MRTIVQSGYNPGTEKKMYIPNLINLKIVF